MDKRNKDVNMPESNQFHDVGPVGENDRGCPKEPGLRDRSPYAGCGQTKAPEAHVGGASKHEACADKLTDDKLKALEEELERLTRERDEWKTKSEENWDRFLRAKSEMENFRKRTQRDIHERVKRGKSDLILSLLDVMDNFDRFLAAGQDKSSRENEDSEFASFFKGVLLIQRQILGLLAKEGVEPIDNPVGKAFDPNFHEAVFAQDGGGEHGTIVEEIQKGYTYGEHVLRPSRVKVIR